MVARKAGAMAEDHDSTSANKRAVAAFAVHMQQGARRREQEDSGGEK